MNKVIIACIIIVYAINISAQNKEVAAILEKHCIKCHHLGAIGPIDFTDPSKVNAYSEMIGYVIREDLMPLWPAEPVEEVSYKFENVLSEQDKKRILEWVKDPGGDSCNYKFTVKEPESIAEADYIIAMEESFEHYGIYYDQYQVFRVPISDLPSPYVSEIEFIPGQKGVIRSCNVSIDLDTTGMFWEKWDPRYGYNSYGGLNFVPAVYSWYHWSAGDGKIELNGFKFLPDSAHLLLHIYYGPSDKVVEDSSFLKINFSDYPPEGDSRIYTLPVAGPHQMTNDSFYLEAEKVSRYHSSFEIPYDLSIHRIFPEAHLLAKEYEIFWVSENRDSSRVLLEIKDWQYHRQRDYIFKDPVRMKKGSKIHVIASYDNTNTNEANPSYPSRDMKFGSGMFDEKFLVHMDVKDADHSSKYIAELKRSIVIADSLHLELKRDGNFKYTIQDWGQLIISSGDFYSPMTEIAAPGREGLYYITIEDSEGNLLQRIPFVKIIENYKF